jgi:hypothetical protein
MKIEVKKIVQNFHSLKVGDAFFIHNDGSILLKVEALHDDFNAVDLARGKLMFINLDAIVDVVTDKVKIVGML